MLLNLERCTCNIRVTQQLFSLQLIPMPVLYGVFLYMGITSLGGVQVGGLKCPCITVGLYLIYDWLSVCQLMMLHLSVCLSIFQLLYLSKLQLPWLCG